MDLSKQEQNSLAGIIKPSSERFKCGDGGLAFCFCETDGSGRFGEDVANFDSVKGWVELAADFGFNVWVGDVGKHERFFVFGEVGEIDIHGLNLLPTVTGQDNDTLLQLSR